MSLSENYLTTAFRDDARELDRTRARIDEVAPTFEGLLINSQFPYEITATTSVSVPAGARYSQSTNAMILFALAAVSGRTAANCPLVPGVTRDKVNLSKSAEEALARAWATLAT